MTTAERMTHGLLAVAALAASCGGSLPGPCEDGSCGTQASWRRTFQSIVSARIDVLFVVDDTPAMTPYAGALAAGFADIAVALEGLSPRVPASLHVGVVRAGRCDQSTRGAGCGIAAGEQFLRAERCGTVTNFSGALTDALTCIGDLGATNCGPAQPLAAAIDALATPPRRGWEGFLRADAYLMVVVIGAGDDASARPAIDVATFIKGLKADPSQAAVSAIVPRSCATGDSPRLTEFVNQFGANGLLADLCVGELAPALQRITNASDSELQPPCLRSVRDTDLDAPGLQADCVFADHPRAADGTWTTATLPSCDVAAPPCWRLVPNAAGCDGYGIDIQRASDWCAEAGTNITIECLACTNANDPACAPAR
jgi:hypothetical protein